MSTVRPSTSQPSGSAAQVDAAAHRAAAPGSADAISVAKLINKDGGVQRARRALIDAAEMLSRRAKEPPAKRAPLENKVRTAAESLNTLQFAQLAKIDSKKLSPGEKAALVGLTRSLRSNRQLLSTLNGGVKHLAAILDEAVPYRR